MSILRRCTKCQKVNHLSGEIDLCFYCGEKGYLVPLRESKGEDLAMSYRDPKQSLESPIHNLIEDIKMFSAVVDAREESNDWTDEHMQEICELDLLLRQVKTKLIRLKQTTW